MVAIASRRSMTNMSTTEPTMLTTLVTTTGRPAVMRLRLSAASLVRRDKVIPTGRVVR